MSINEITTKAREVKELIRMKEELEAEITSLQDEIKAHMGADEEVTAGEYKIRWTTVKSNRFDTTAFKTKYNDLYDQFTKESITRRFSIA
ncbi:MAG: hypothetical protein FWF15_01795 [Oscillospiraceae bacterium]|nr:hypothetical protein [Oscillospiraceae bacterium]